MAQKRNIVIKTPRGSIYTVKTANGSVTSKLRSIVSRTVSPVC